MNPAEECIELIKGRVIPLFPHVKKDKLKKAFKNVQTNITLNEWATDKEKKTLFIVGDNLIASIQIPSELPERQKIVYFVKLSDEDLTVENFASSVLSGECTDNLVGHLQKVLGQIYVPLVTNSANQDRWGEVASTDLSNNLHAFLANVSITMGQIKGTTALPLPPVGNASAGAGQQMNNTMFKDRVHLFESAVITWTKQIKKILHRDPETSLKAGLNPTPDKELEFWTFQSVNLNSIYDQLQSEQVRMVLRFLDMSKSTYCTPFANLCREVFTARYEANDNIKFLNTLADWFNRLNQSQDFVQLVQLFKPIMHVVLLIWKNAKYYNTPARLAVLIRQMGNSLINAACKFVSGELIFTLIESEEIGTAIEKVKQTLEVCGAFKTTYFAYKETANAECPSNPWRVQNNSLFMRLDNFLDRCHDVLDLVQTIEQFYRLERIDVGGTKGKQLSETVQQIFGEFQAVVTHFQQMDYDLMDVDAEEFKTDFDEFKSTVEELEKRIGSLLTEGFEDSNSLVGRFKLLDSFSGLLERPVIEDELEKRYLTIVHQVSSDLRASQELFLTYRDDPPIPSNLPPFSGAITWCRGIKDRIKKPIQKMKKLHRNIMEREESKETAKLHENLVESLDEYILQKIGEWSRDVETSSQGKLKLPLLRRGRESGLLVVNFDKELIRLLREVKYFLLLQLPIPESAGKIYESDEIFRAQRGKLEMVTGTYNTMMTELLPVEKPLVQGYIDKIDNTVVRGIKDMNWKSPTINTFIDEAWKDVQSCHKILTTLKGNLTKIEDILESWRIPLLERAPTPVSIADFSRSNKELQTKMFAVIKEGGSSIHKLLKNTRNVLRVNASNQDWKYYVEFVNDVVVDGLAKVVTTCLDFLIEQFDPVICEKNETQPMLQLQLELKKNAITYTPELGETQKKQGLVDIVRSWVDSFMQSGMIFKRLDMTGGTYAKELFNHMDIQFRIERAHDLLAASETKCAAFKADFEAYSYLFNQNLTEAFEIVKEDCSEEKYPGFVEYDLNRFEEEIEKYNKIATAIREKPKFENLGWLRVETTKAKQDLEMWAAKWAYKFTKHLKEDVHVKLQNLNDFIRVASSGLETMVDGEDKEVLMDVMGHIRDVKKKMDPMKSMMKPLRETFALLKKYNVEFDEVKVGQKSVDEEGNEITLKPVDIVGYLEQAPSDWNKLVNQTFSKKEQITPFQDAQVSNIKHQMEEFFLEVRSFRTEFRKKAPFKLKITPLEAYANLDDYFQRVTEVNSKVANLQELEELFELQIVSYPEIKDTMRDLNILKKVWDLKAIVEFYYQEWKTIGWHDVDTDKLLLENKKLAIQIKNFGNDFPIAKQWESYRDVETDVKNMAVLLPIVAELHAPAMRLRHWASIAKIVGVNKIDVQSSTFCLADISSLNVEEFEEPVLDVVETAMKELKIDKKLKIIEGIWDELSLGFKPHKESDIQLIFVTEEVVEELEAHQMELQSMIGMGKYVAFFRGQVTAWQKTLGNVDVCLKKWSTVIKQWAGLESIFLGSADIRAQLPDDTKRFEGIDQEFKDLQKSAEAETNVAKACNVEGRIESISQMLVDLELCQKALNEYLDMKKKVYPRFYFLSNNALLDILSNGNNPPKIQKHFGDCYQSIQKLVWDKEIVKEEDDQGNEIDVEVEVTNRSTKYIAKDGEILEFKNKFKIKGPVESWLNDMTDHLQSEMKNVLEQAVQTGAHWDSPDDKSRHEWVFDHCAQMVVTATLLYWTEETETALEEFEGGQEDAVKKYKSLLEERLNQLIKLVQGKLGKSERKKIITVITMDVHSKDVVARLVKEKTEGPYSFAWQQQMRQYWVAETQTVNIRIVDYRAIYAYEPIGNVGRLVITPLTDRCYITLATALRLMLGGAPAGPAGTGKTETVKDMSRCIALPIYVFNCSPQMNYQSLANIFKGLSQTGAWGCFDEFNRISISVLSVVATQVGMIIDAINRYSVPANREKKYQHLPAGTPPFTVGKFDLLGDPITLIPSVGIFITMNPGYAGRTELPENIKALFRTCAMIRPDLAIICENMLMSEGFLGARDLAIKFTTLYGLSGGNISGEGGLLSKQPHYDWGLRAIASVLRVAGVMKRGSPEQPEEMVLMRALRDFNTPKIPNWDIPIFLRLIQDLFPLYADNTPTQVDESLKAIVIKVCPTKNLMPQEDFVHKCLNLQDLLDVRHSVMLMGPGGCGKTTIWRTLRDAHNMGHEKNRIAISEIINPKALTVDEIFGYMTLAKDWKDGVLSIMMRGMSKNDRDLGYKESQTMKWIIFDGDVDTYWIESMNTVMDANKVLTLVSNERIDLTPQMRVVCELDSLKNASPATVSRNGLLYINESDIGWRPAVDIWLKTREDKNETNFLPALFDKYIEATQFMSKSNGLIEISPVRILTKANAATAIVARLLEQMTAEQKTQEALEQVFLFACIWGFGGPLCDDRTNENRTKFDECFQSQWKEALQAQYPKDTSVFDYYYNPKEEDWVAWEDDVTPYEYQPIGWGPGQTDFSYIYVTYSDTVKNEKILQYLVEHEQPICLVGLAGTGKTAAVQKFLAAQDPEFMLNSAIDVNFYTEHRNIQAEIENVIDKRSGRVFGPPPGKKMLYFLDDLNLPEIEEFGTQNALSMLRMIMDLKTFYDREDLSFRKEIVDAVYVASMNPTAGSFHVADRVQRHFAVLACDIPSEAESKSVYLQILDGHLQGMDFASNIASHVEKIVDATIFLHKTVLDKFLPGAIKFMYIWNLRELANIVRGLCRAESGTVVDMNTMVRLWGHETDRVFADRLINAEEGEKFRKIQVDCATKYFGDVANVEEALDPQDLLFTSFFGSKDNFYNLVPEFEGLQTILDSKLEEYNENNTIMELVLFKEAIEHVCRICRVIEYPGGNTMLVGVGGSGKQSLSRLAGFIMGCTIEQLKVSSKYNVDDLKEDLKRIYMEAGVKGRMTLFIMTDSQVVKDHFLVYLNNMLASGRIPGLFEKDEIDNIIGSLRNPAKQAGIPDTPIHMFDFFISRIKKFLHISLCFSPVGDWFRVRARRFPGLINLTVIDQFHPWPKAALESVALRFISDLEIDDAVKQSISVHMGLVHLSVRTKSVVFKERLRRFNYVTPKSFLELIAFYKVLLSNKTNNLNKQIYRLDVGLSKLKKTSEDVAELRVDLDHTMVKVADKKKSTDALLVHIGEERAQAEIIEGKASAEAAIAGEASDAAAVIEAEAEVELAKAKPAMDAANEAVNCLDKNSLGELRGFAKPPNGVDVCMKAVLMMMEGEFKNHSWDRAKKMMSNLGQFLEDLKSYKAEEMSDHLMNKLEPIVAEPVMEYDTMKGKSIAAANLSSWVCNVYAYKRIYDKVKPLMDALDEAQAKKAAAQESLERAQGEVAEIKVKLAALGEQLKIATAEKLIVEKEAAKCLEKLNLAERLVSGLSSEGDRWGFEIGEMKKSGDTLVGDSLLAGAFVSYIGAFNAEYRDELWKIVWLADIHERGIPITAGIDPLNVLTDDGNNAQMMSEGLPADRMSIENGSMITQTSRWPLLIDPQLQGIKWLRKRENMAADRKAARMRAEAEAAGEDPNLIVVASNLVTLQLSNANWLKRLSGGIANGNTVIFENCPAELDATLDPVLQRAIYRKGRTMFLQLAGEELEYDKNFRLYLQTKLSNPHYKPEIFACCTLINFIATERGLEDQLLAKVVNVEKPELEKEKQVLIAQFNEYKIKLLNLEDDLLEKLSNAPEDILSDIPLVEGLEATKKAAVEIEAAVKKGKETEVAINKAREVYRPVASEASMMYFICTEMCNIDHMYQYSLGAFTYFFFKSISKTALEADILKRVAALRASMRFTVFTWVCRGLATEHKIVYMTQIAIKLMKRAELEEKFDPESFNFLMRGQKSMGADNPVSWLPNINWLMVNSLAKIEGFEKFPSDLNEAAPRFLEWYNHETPETEKLPLDWSGLEKEPFKKLLVLRALRPDRLVIAITKWLRNALPDGNMYVDADSTNSSLRILELAVEDSTPAVPIFFILSPGTDVVADVDKLADRMELEKGISYWNVGMGQGQDVVAMDRLQLGHTQGHWVILNNCHLMPEWCIELEKKLDNFNVEGSHERFRVFLTAEPSPYIPIGILSRCIKLTNEPPAGLRANLKRAFCSFDPDDFDELDSKQKAIIFALSFYHAILIERKKFGTKGFNMMYPFSLGDLRDSSIVLGNYMDNASSSKIPWEDLRYLFGEITYGGHIVNDLDRLLNITYLDFYLQDNVLDQKEMFPYVENEKGVSFKTPMPTTWELYNKHIDEYLTSESPLAFGLHPNAEIDFRLNNSNDVLLRLTELQPRDASGGEGTMSPTEIAEQAMGDIKEKINDFIFDMFELNSTLEGDLKGPYQNCFLQECDIMNILTVEMRRSLKELKMGFDGELTMSSAMEDLQLSLYLDRIPKIWDKLAWNSMRPLAAWVLDLCNRFQQLTEWTQVPTDIPRVVWLSGLINPPSFLTAIKQVTAQKAKLPLDSIIIQTDVTKKMERKDLEGPAKDGGAYCSGFYLEGARWDLENQLIVKSKPKEMFVQMPIINCRGILSSAQETVGIFMCPVYTTQFRGPTFVFMAQFKTKSPGSRWILAGVAAVLDVGE